MDDQTSDPTSRSVTDTLDASVRDLAEGNVHDAQSVQAEAHRMLADHARAQRAAPVPPAARPAKRARSG